MMVAEPVKNVTDGGMNRAAIRVVGQSCAKLFFGLIETACLEKEITKVVASSDELGFQFDSASEIALCFGIVAERDVDFGNIVVNNSHVRLDLECRFEGLQCFFVSTQIVEGYTEIAIAVGSRKLFDGLIELVDRFAGATCSDEGIGVITACLPGVCVAVNGGLPESINGFVCGGLLPSEDAKQN